MKAGRPQPARGLAQTSTKLEGLSYPGLFVGVTSFLGDGVSSGAAAGHYVQVETPSLPGRFAIAAR
jgi:hypothetical protein